MFRNARALPKDGSLDQHTEAFAERREAHRIHTVCRFARVVSRCDRGLWRVCNISDRGMMFRTHRNAAPGERLSIALSDDVTLEAVVVWSDAERCGVRFNAPIDSGALLCALAQAQRSPHYRPLRLDVDGWALAFDETGVHSVRIRNLSRCGVGLSHLNRIQAGRTVKLVLENGTERRGVVRWADQEQAGLSLLEPFTSDELASASQF